MKGRSSDAQHFWHSTFKSLFFIYIFLVKFLRLSSISILLQLSVSSHATRTCPLADNRSQANFLPDPDNCQKFVVCDHGVAVSRYCPAGLHWNSVASSCDYPTRAKCQIFDSVTKKPIKIVAVEPVQNLANGAIYSQCLSADFSWKSIQLPYPEDATKFLKCSNGRVWILDCPRGLQWNAARNRCDYLTNIKYLINEIEKPINSTSLTDLTSTLGTTKNDRTETELRKDTANKPLTTDSVEFRTSPLLSEKLSEQSNTTTKITNLYLDKKIILLNMDVKESIETLPLNQDFENSEIFTKGTTKLNKLMQFTPTFLGENATQQPEKTISIGNAAIVSTNYEENTILSESEDLRGENHHKLTLEFHIPAVQETTHFSIDQIAKQTETNIDRPITKTPERFTSNSTFTAKSIKQTTKRTTSIPKEITTSEYDTTFIIHNKWNDSLHQQIAELKEQPVQLDQYEDTTKTRMFKAAADSSILLFGNTKNRTLYMPLSKNSTDVYSSPNNTENDIEEKQLNTRSPQDKTALDNISTEFSITATTFDPRLPFKAVECEGINNEERFPTTDCRKYYQCLYGYAYLLNCFDGYTFSLEHKICILSDQCEA